MEYSLGGNCIKEFTVPDFLFDFNTIYGRIYHRLAAENYFRTGRIFQNGGRRHLEFLKFPNVKGRECQEGQKCVTVPNSVAIGQTVAEIWRLFDFSKMAAVHHLGYVMSVFGPPTNGFWWSLSLYKIWLESMQ